MAPSLERLSVAILCHANVRALPQSIAHLRQLKVQYLLLAAAHHQLHRTQAVRTQNMTSIVASAAN